MTAPETLTVSRNAVRRGWVIGVAAIAIILGIIAFLVPGTTLLAVAIIFGIFLIASGTSQLVNAFTSVTLSGWARWLTGLLGGLTLVAGILCLSNPWGSLTILGIVIGAGWIFGGVASIVERAGRDDKRRWLPVTAGIASIIAGILVMVMPVLALKSFVIVAAILMILIGVATLFLLSTGGAPAVTERARPAAPARTPHVDQRQQRSESSQVDVGIARPRQHRDLGDVDETLDIYLCS